MTERNRILDLMKKGVLSTSEGLDLLENLAKKEDKRVEEKEFDDESGAHATTDFEEDEKSFDVNLDDESTKNQDKENLEAEYEALANSVNKLSVRVDEINEEISALKVDRTDVQGELDSLTSDFEEEKQEEIREIQLELDDYRKELSLVQAMDEIDNAQEVKQLKNEIAELEKALVDAESRDDTDNQNEIEDLESQLSEFDGKIEELQTEKAEIMKELHSARMKQWSAKAKRMSSKIEIPDEWKSEASHAFSKAGETIESTSKDLSGLIKQSVLNAKDALDSIEWKDRSFKVPTIASTTFEKEWIFDEHNPTILDFKNANGDISIKQSDNESIHVESEITLYGKMDEETSEKAFENRSKIESDEDKLTFHIPNKRVKAELTIYLPKQTYDYIAVNMLNGNLVVNEVDVNDIYVKSTNGDFQLNKLEAVMMEVKGTNGDVLLNDANIKDLIINTIHGNIRIQGKVKSSNATTTNGDIRTTLTGTQLTQTEVVSINGDVKVAVPDSIDIEVDAKTVFGEVKSRLTNVREETRAGSSKMKKTFTRLKEGNPMRIVAKSTTGNVLLKDTDQ